MRALPGLADKVIFALPAALGTCSFTHYKPLWAAGVIILLLYKQLLTFMAILCCLLVISFVILWFFTCTFLCFLINLLNQTFLFTIFSCFCRHGMRVDTVTEINLKRWDPYAVCDMQYESPFALCEKEPNLPRFMPAACCAAVGMRLLHVFPKPYQRLAVLS